VTQLRPGQKLKSAVCEAQLVVVKPASTDVDVRCGGVPMMGESEEPPAGVTLDPSLGDGPLIGKRYEDAVSGLELLCSRTGSGAVTVDGRAVNLKGAKPLPSSD
jgi:hypothetical protein